MILWDQKIHYLGLHKRFAAFLKSAANWWFYPVILIGIAIGGVIAYIRTPQGRYQWHLFKYKAPIFGALIYAVDFSRVNENQYH